MGIAAEVPAAAFEPAAGAFERLGIRPRPRLGRFFIRPAADFPIRPAVVLAAGQPPDEEQPPVAFPGFFRVRPQPGMGLGQLAVEFCGGVRPHPFPAVLLGDSGESRSFIPRDFRGRRGSRLRLARWNLRSRLFFLTLLYSPLLCRYGNGVTDRYALAVTFPVSSLPLGARPILGRSVPFPEVRQDYGVVLRVVLGPPDARHRRAESGQAGDLIDVGEVAEFERAVGSVFVCARPRDQ